MLLVSAFPLICAIHFRIPYFFPSSSTFSRLVPLLHSVGLLRSFLLLPFSTLRPPTPLHPTPVYQSISPHPSRPFSQSTEALHPFVPLFSPLPPRTLCLPWPLLYTLAGSLAAAAQHCSTPLPSSPLHSLVLVGFATTVVSALSSSQPAPNLSHCILYVIASPSPPSIPPNLLPFFPSSLFSFILNSIASLWPVSLSFPPSSYFKRKRKREGERLASLSPPLPLSPSPLPPPTNSQLLSPCLFTLSPWYMLSSQVSNNLRSSKPIIFSYHNRLAL